MIESIPEIGVEAHKDDNNTLFIDYWESSTGWVENILWSDFINKNGISTLIHRLYDYFNIKKSILLINSNPNLRENSNISDKLKIKIVRNILSTYYSEKTFRSKKLDIDTSKTDIIFYTNGDIVDNIDSNDCNIECSALKHLHNQIDIVRQPGFFKKIHKDLF